MSTKFDITETLDVKGLNCPMPVVKTKQATDSLAEAWNSSTKRRTRRVASRSTSTTFGRRSDHEYGHAERQ
jgi:hypothetical protein